MKLMIRVAWTMLIMMRANIDKMMGRRHYVSACWRLEKVSPQCMSATEGLPRRPVSRIEQAGLRYLGGKMKHCGVNRYAVINTG